MREFANNEAKSQFFTLNKKVCWSSQVARTVNKDEVKGKAFLREHYSASDRNFPHVHPPSLWLEWVSTATIMKTRLGSSKLSGNEASGSWQS